MSKAGTSISEIRLLAGAAVCACGRPFQKRDVDDEQCRHCRNAVVPLGSRPRVESVRRLPIATMRAFAADDLAETADIPRPITRADCLPGGMNEDRPCPFVSCVYHLAVDAEGPHRLRITWPGRELEEIEHTCSLDVADEGGHTLEQVAGILNLTRERVRQIEDVALIHAGTLELLAHRHGDADA